LPSTKCPRCSSAIAATPDELGFVVCANCGAKLRSKTPTVVKVQGSSLPPPPSGDAEGLGDIDSVLARLDRPDPAITLPPGTPLKKIPRPGAPGAPGMAAPAASPAAPAASTAPASSGATLDALLAEIRAVRRAQEEILALLRGPTPADRPPAESSYEESPFTLLDDPQAAQPLPAPPVVRSRRRKTVLLIDDDDASRKAAVEALEHAQVPVKTASDGNSGLASIAIEKPDVIAIELGMGGSMAGKDVINMIKATMEWVDIPIVLYTRLSIENQKEARTTHGADEFVPKGQGPEALVAKIIMLFRKG
jgi:CheY-like chemotaxis protein